MFIVDEAINNLSFVFSNVGYNFFICYYLQPFIFYFLTKIYPYYFLLNKMWTHILEKKLSRPNKNYGLVLWCLPKY